MYNLEHAQKFLENTYAFLEVEQSATRSLLEVIKRKNRDRERERKKNMIRQREKERES